MTASPEKAPKKIKEKRQTPEERLEAMRYNHMMYGPTEGELKMAPKKVDYGAPFLKHPKFLGLMTAFRKGTSSSFDISAAGKNYTIATDNSQISFNGRVLFYSRPLNRHEDNLLLDKNSAIQHQTNDPVIHLIFAVMRSFPEMETPQLQYSHRKFFNGIETLETSAAEQGANLLIGAYKHNKVQEKPRK